MPDLTSWRATDVILLVLFAGGILIAITAIVGGYWTAIRTAEMNAELKRDMIQRGIPVADIERLLGTPAESSTVLLAEVVQSLGDNDFGASDIECVLKVLPQVTGYSASPTPNIERKLFELIESLASNGNDGEGIARILLAMPGTTAQWTAAPQLVERPT